MDEIFEQFKNKKQFEGKTILRDGIIDQQRWKSSRRKLLFILKEYYNDQKEFGGDHSRALGEWSKRGSIGNPFFKNLFSWSLAVHYPGHEPPSDGYEVDQWEQSRIAFQQSALINLKKFVGSSQSSDADIKHHVLATKDLLKEQILQIGPDIVICGGTMKYINNIIFHLCPVQQEADVCIDRESDIFFIEADHPSYKKAHDAFYDEHGFIQEAMTIISNSERLEQFNEKDKMARNLTELANVKALWIWENKIFNYVGLPETLTGNEKAGTLRVTLRELERGDKLEILIKVKNGNYCFRHDDAPGKEYPLKRFNSENETIFYYTNTNDDETIYLHCDK